MSYTDGLYTIKVSYIFSITLILFPILYFTYYYSLFSFSNNCWIIFILYLFFLLMIIFIVFFLYIVFFFLLYFFLLYYIFLFYITTMISIIFISIIILIISIIFSIRNLLVWLILGCEIIP